MAKQISPVKEESKSLEKEEKNQGENPNLYLQDRAEPLNKKTKKLAEPFLSHFDESLLEMVFSKTWGFRENALEIIKEELRNKSYTKILDKDPEKIFVYVLSLMSQLIIDKVSNVSTKAMAIVDIALKFYPNPIEKAKIIFNAELEKCLGSLMDQIGDNLQKVRLKAHETVVNLGQNVNVGIKGLLNHLNLNSTKKPQQSARHLMGKLRILIDLVRIYSLDEKSPEFKGVINIAMQGAKHPTAEVRNEGYALLVEIYKIVGTSIYNYLEELRPAQKEMLEEEFKKSGGVISNRPKNTNRNILVEENEEEQPKIIVTTNINSQGGSKAKVTKPIKKESKKSNSPQKIENVPEKTCEYCGKFDPNFTEDKLDLHMYKDCQMLHMCKHCGNIVEILLLTNHLLKECSASKNYVKCPVCKEAIVKQYLDEHIQAGGCASYNPDETIRCPLCHADINPATLDAWKNHILVEGCPENSRKPK